MSGHTPGPWKVSAMGTGNIVGDSGRRLVANCAGHQNNITAEQVAAENDANAELIVRAVNSHAALVEALEEARDFIREFKSEIPLASRLLPKLNAALAAAKVTK